MNTKLSKIALLALFSMTTGCGNSSDDKPHLDLPEPPPAADYDNEVRLDLAPLAGKQGVELLQAIEDQLNARFNTRLQTASAAQFKITPKWGHGAESWDDINLSVVQLNGDYVLQTQIDAQAVGAPSAANTVKNGFSFKIDLPNGLTTSAVMNYQFWMSQALGTNADNSPDYIFFPGFTSGDPLVSNTASPLGAGFTYKYNTDKYGYLNTRYMDPSDNVFFNKKLLFEATGGRLKAQSWNSISQRLAVNEFLIDSLVPADNGKLTSLYNGGVATTDVGETENRIMIDSQHRYQLQGLFEVYRHFKHSSDAVERLKEQVISFKDISFGWDNAQVTLPELPPEPERETLCTGYANHANYLDLAALHAEGATSGQALLDGIGAQLGDLPAGSVIFEWGVSDINLIADNSSAGEFQLKVDYAAGTKAKADGNGTGFKVAFPAVDGQLTGTCMAFKMKATADLSPSSSYVFVPGMQYLDDATVLGDHRYSTNKYRRMAAKFGNPLPHKDLGWLDYGGNAMVNHNTWYTLRQLMLVDATGKGSIDLLLDGASYFKQNAGKFDGIAFADVKHQLFPAEKLATMQVVANFDTYQNVAAKTAQTLYYKDIAIGWSLASDE